MPTKNEELPVECFVHCSLLIGKREEITDLSATVLRKSVYFANPCVRTQRHLHRCSPLKYTHITAEVYQQWYCVDLQNLSYQKNVMDYLEHQRNKMKINNNVLFLNLILSHMCRYL